MNRDPLYLVAWRLNRGWPLLILGLLLLNLVVFCSLVYVVSPEVENWEREFIEVQSSSRQVRRAAEAPHTPQEVFRRNQQDLLKFKQSVPDRSEFTDLIGELFILAKQTGLSVDQIGYAPKEFPEEGLLGYSLNFSVTGSYAELKRFIHGLEQSPRLISIDQLGMSSAADRKGSGHQVGLTLKLTTYFRSMPL